MEYAVIGIIVAAIIAVGGIFFIKMRKKPANKSQDSTQLLPQEKKSELVSSNESLNELVIQMEKLPAEKIPVQNKLVEIKDNKVSEARKKIQKKIRDKKQNIAAIKA